MLFRLLRTAVAVAILTTFSTSTANTIGHSQATTTNTAASKPPMSTAQAPIFNKSARRNNNELCKQGTFDAIFNSPDRDIYVFKGDKYWKLAEEGVEPGYPQIIGRTWIGLPNNIDTAFTDNNGKTYFFKGSQYWRYTDKDMDVNYPQLISETLPGIPDNVDVALMWNDNRKIYFFKDTQYWEFDPRSNPPVNSIYPKLISNWEGLPNNLDAALKRTDQYTFFFKNGMYYLFNDRKFAVVNYDPPFPQPTGVWWFGCRNENSGIITAEH